MRFAEDAKIRVTKKSSWIFLAKKEKWHLLKMYVEINVTEKTSWKLFFWL